MDIENKGHKSRPGDLLVVDVTKWRKPDAFFAFLAISFFTVFPGFIYFDILEYEEELYSVEGIAAHLMLYYAIVLLPVLLPWLLLRVFQKLFDKLPNGPRIFNSLLVNKNHFDPSLDATVGSISEALFNDPDFENISYRKGIEDWPLSSLLYIIGFLLICSTFVAFFVWGSGDSSEGMLRFLFWCAVGIAGTCGGLFLRSTAKSAAELIETDTRDPVLWLRSFEDDDRVQESPLSHLAAHDVFLPRFEQDIAHHFKPFGPVIAIGSPSELLPKLGAAKAYYEDSEWQDAVLSAMNKARLIVVTLGISKGLDWEISTLLSNGFLHKTIFIVLPGDDSDTGQSLSRLRSLLETSGKSLPPSLNEQSVRQRNVGAFYVGDETTVVVGYNRSILRYSAPINPLIYYAAVYAALCRH